MGGDGWSLERIKDGSPEWKQMWNKSDGGFRACTRACVRACVCVFPVAAFMLQASLEKKNTSHRTEFSAWETGESNRRQKPTWQIRVVNGFSMFGANMEAVKKINPRAWSLFTYSSPGSQGLEPFPAGSRSPLELRARNSKDLRVTCLKRSSFHVYSHFFSVWAVKS